LSKKWDALPGRSGLQGWHALADYADLPSSADTFQSRAQTEPLDTDLRRGTATPKQMLQERLETASAPYSFIHFPRSCAERASSNAAQRVHHSASPGRKTLILGKSEAHFARETDEKDAVQRFIWGSGAGRSRGVETQGQPLSRRSEWLTGSGPARRASSPVFIPTSDSLARTA